MPKLLDRFFKAEKEYDIKTHLIFGEGLKKHQPNAKVRYLPKEYISPIRIIMCDSKLYISEFTKPITTIVIDKPEISAAFIAHFKLLWKMTKP